MDPAKTILLRFSEHFSQQHEGWPAPIHWPKDMKLAKALLEVYTPAQVELVVAHFFQMPDPFIQQSGYSFGVLYACFGKVLIDYQRQQKRQQQLARQNATQIQAIQQMQDWRNMSIEERQLARRKIAEG